MSLDTRLDTAATAICEEVDPEPAPFSRVRSRARRRRANGAALVVIVAVVASFAVLKVGDSSQDNTLRLGTRPSTSRPPVSVVSPPGTIPMPTVPVAPPQGSEIVDYHGFRLFVPTTWKIERDRCPSGRAHAVTLGARPGDTCSLPNAKAAWMWLRPLDQSLAATAQRCGPGFVNNLPICQVIDEAAHTEVLFVEGLDIALVRSLPGKSDPEYGEVTNSWQYSDSTRPEAAGSGTLGQGAYPLPQPLFTAQQFVAAYLAGDCARAQEFADPSYVPTCPPGDDTIQVFGGTLTGVGGSVPTVGARINTSTGRSFQVSTANKFSLEHRRIENLVTGITEVDPSTPLPGPGDQYPDCVPIAGPTDAVGCARKADLFGTPGGPPPITETPDPRRVPVFADATQRRVVGYFVDSLGFVPNRLMQRVDDLHECNTQEIARVQGQTAERLSNRCHALLNNWREKSRSSKNR